MGERAKQQYPASALELPPPTLAPIAGDGGTSREDELVPAILGLDRRTGSDWFYLGIALAFLAHVGMLGAAMVSQYMHELQSLVMATQAELDEYFNGLYEIEIAQKQEEEKPPEPPPPPPPDPEPPPPAPAAAPQPKDDPYDQPPPPTPAEAAKVLVQEPDDEEIEDLTGNTIVTGEGSATYGMQSATGKGDKPVMNPAASHSGVPGGTGTAPAPPPPPPQGPDLSKLPTPIGGNSWNCPFPPESDVEQIDQAAVGIVVTVRPDGTALSVSVTNDPGYGFGRQARMCALSRRYNPGLDRSGKPTTLSVPMTVRFNR